MSRYYIWYINSIWLAFIAGFVDAVFLATGIWEWVSPSPEMSDGSRLPRLLTLGCGALLLLLVALPFFLRWRGVHEGAARYGAEQDWLKSLPFEVTGYLELLERHSWVAYLGSGGSRGMSTTQSRMFFIEVQPHFVGERPGRDLLGKLADGLFGENHVSDDASFRFRASRDRKESALALRAAISELLLPLHEKYPLRSVRFSVIE